MDKPKWVLADVVKAIHNVLLSKHGGREGIIYIVFLGPTLNKAPQKFAYNSKINIFELAAAYSFGIAKNYPFMDGNKRTAFMAGAIF